MSKARLWLMARILVTLGLLGWLLLDSRLRAQFSSIPSPSSPLWLVVAWLCAGIGEAASLVRFWCCLRLAGIPLPLSRVVALHFGGMFTSLFLPGTAGGDALKITLLALQFPQKKFAGVVAVLLDRLSGFVIITAWTVFVAVTRADWFAREAFPNSMLRAALWVAGPLAFALVLWFAASRTNIMRKRFPSFPLRARILECEAGFDALAGDLPRAVAMQLLSLVAFGGYFLLFHFTALAFGAKLAVVDSLSAMPLLDIVTMLPITIAGLGLREHTFQTVFAPLCGIPASIAVVTSLVGFLLGSSWALLGVPAFLGARPVLKNPATHV